MAEFSRRDLLSTAVVAGASMTASAADAGEQILVLSFADAHLRRSSGGRRRQVSVRELCLSKAMAGVNIWLNAGGVRERHWHEQAECVYMLYGTARITVIDAQGRNLSCGECWCRDGDQLGQFPQILGCSQEDAVTRADDLPVSGQRAVAAGVLVHI
jgi:oxalate decarboxylase/phosphoglucose isomerase-like protein (cupin superfamily)